MSPCMVGERPSSCAMVGMPTERVVRSARLITVSSAITPKMRQRTPVLADAAPPITDGCVVLMPVFLPVSYN